MDLLAVLRRRLANVVRRAVVALIDDSPKMQLAQINVQTDGDTCDGCERFQEYGFSSVPLKGAEAVVLFVGGLRDHPLVIAIDDRRSRKRGLQPGEVCLYTDEGDFLIFERGGHVTIHASSDVTIDAPSLHLTGDLTVDGDITVPSGDVVADTVHLKTHRHGGVQSGGSLTGTPV
jgi:phage gp45-like